VDWRAPAAAVFYQATAAEPSGVVRRRVLRCAGQTVTAVEDDLLDADSPAAESLPVVGGRRSLERAGYLVLATGDAEAAIAAADRHPGHIHLLVTDVLLPRVSGRELAARLAIHRPAIKVLFVSGTSDGAIARHRMLEPGTEFLEKPFPLVALLRTVRQILGVDHSAEDATPWMQRSLV
jgi:FixJ family two-component response regulator